MQRERAECDFGRRAADMSHHPRLSARTAGTNRRASIICNWTGQALNLRWKSMAWKGGGGKVADVFTHSPVDSLAKAMEPTNFLGYETTEAAGKVVGIIAQDHCAKSCKRLDTRSP